MRLAFGHGVEEYGGDFRRVAVVLVFCYRAQ